MVATSRYIELILGAVIKCGLLRKILNTANHQDLLLVLPKSSGGRESRDIWRHVMKEAKDAGLLRDILEAAHRCGRYEEAVAGAVDGGVLDVHEEAEKVAQEATNDMRCFIFRIVHVLGSRPRSIFKALTYPEIDIVQRKLVEQATKAGVMRNVLEGAIQSGKGLFCFEIKSQWKLSAILTVAKEAGVLVDVLQAAAGCGRLGMTLAAAKEAGVLADVLQAAAGCGRLGMTLAAAKEAGVLADVLQAAAGCGLLEMTVAAAKEAAVLMHVLQAAAGCGLLGMTMAKAKEAGVLMDALQAAARCDQLGHVATEAYGDIVLREALRVAGICNFVTKVVKDKVLEELFIQVVQHGLLKYLVQEAEQSRILRSILMQASKSGMIRRSWEEAKRRGVNNDDIAKSVRLLQNIKGAKTADMKIMLQTFLSGSTLDAYSLMSSFPVDLICDEEDDSAPPIQKAHSLLILAWLLLIVLTLVRGRGLSRTRNAEHRKSVISQVTICSGDIERNPSPDVILNDWLKEMYSELVRRLKGWKKKNIPWKQFRLPDPRNSGQDRDTLLALISRLGLLTLCDNHDTSDLYVDEFLLLRDNINDIKRLNLDVLDWAVKKRKILVKARELDNEMSLLPEDERRKAQRAVHGLQLQHVAFYRQGAVEEQVEEEESEGDVDEDFDEDGGHDVEIKEGSPPLPQPDCPRGAAVAGDEANMLLSSSIEDSKSSSENTLDALEEFLNIPNLLQFNEIESFQFNESLLLSECDESTQNVPQNEARSPKRDAPSDHTPNDVMSWQRSETMEDKPEVTDDKHTLQPRGTVEIQSQSQKSQSTIEPDQAPAPTPAPPTSSANRCQHSLTSGYSCSELGECP
ncbi:uncharacterized protein LOC124113134 isoform X2 [Haliotis rufescens]|uniref:uncharacterized protein LOC124113134 isoform X2 n=1 Tax=Haliotis rufescens TaxID=6454 RepID=UPI00201ECAEE|nr:uncharacterized protein LOC124113134 isoform X2 [Haliotis rufescens]